MTELHAEQNFKINRRARIEVTPLYGICPEILIKSELFKPFFSFTLLSGEICYQNMV